MKLKKITALFMVLTLLLSINCETVFAEASTELVNHAKGKTYESSIACHDGGMKDHGGDLTDGKSGSLGDGSGYTNIEWVGYNPKNDSVEQGKLFSIVVDLGASKDIGKIRTNYGQSYGNGIIIPEKVTYYISNDKTNWTKVTEITHALDATPVTTYSFIWDGNETKVNDQTKVIGQYVKAEIDAIYPTSEGEWTLIDEFEAFEPAAIEPSEPPVPEPEPGVIGNLARGKAYTISTPAHPDYQDTGKKELTDGIYGIAGYADSAWQGHTGGDPLRTFEIDLGKIDTITKITSNFLAVPEGAVKMPAKYDIQVSEDGIKWSTLPSDIFIPKPEKPSTNKITWEASRNLTPNQGQTKVAVSARYVRVIFGWQNWCMIDEIEVIGEIGKQDYAVTLKEDIVKEPAYTKAGEATGGINNLLLIYNGYYESGVGTWTENDYDPYLVYRDKNKKAIDTMFDGYLFLGLRTPFNHTLAGATSQSEAGDIDDWKWYIEKTFTANGDLDNLSKATEKAAKDLAQPNLKAKAVLTIPYPDPKQIDFGDVDKDGLSECLNPQISGELAALDAKKKVVNWYINTVMKEWNAKNYNNIELAGFYWLEEDVNEPQIVRYTNDFIKNMNLTSYWIPWNGATNYPLWERLGFEAVAYQPNHSFHGTAVTRIKESADKAKAYGTSIEMELDASAIKGNPDIYQRYLDYLDGGVDFGYDDTSVYKAYYQDVKALRDAALSTSPKIRYLYDATYQFMKGTYTKGYLKYMTEENVTYADIIDVNSALQSIDKKLALEGNSQEEINFLNAEKARVKKFKDLIENNKSKLDSIMTSFLNVNPQDLVLADFDNLNVVVADANLLLESDNLTDRQRRDLTTKMQQLTILYSELLPVKKAYESILLLPEAVDINSTHTKLIQSAKTAYKLLSVHQISLLSDEMKSKYQAVITAFDKLYPTPEPTPGPDLNDTVSTVTDVNNTGISITIPSEVTNVVNPILEVKELTGGDPITVKFVNAANGFALLKTFEINLYSNIETKVTAVEGGKIKVAIPFSGEAGKAYVVLRYNDDGSITELTATYAEGKISFETDHFSVYAVAVKTAPIKPTPDIPNPQTGDTTPIYPIFILFIIACALFFKVREYSK